MDTSNTDSQALPPGTRLHEFVIERVLGAGGFGITYLARDVSLNRQVVIKENLPTQFAWRETATGTVRPRHTSGGDADDYEWSMNNFLREAETLASLDHHGIVRVLRKFEANGTAYFVMPFVDGVALDTLIEERRSKNSPFSEQELRGLLERMLDALAYLHDRGIYHRDIKPGNILISNEGVPALIDFGSARQRLSERSMTVIESPGYTPFEQLQSRGNVGPWSDLYALGGTLCKAITGMTPPKATDRMIGDPWVGLAAGNPAHSPFSDGFLQAIDRSMAVDPSQRWQDARQWQHRLQTGTAKKSSSTQSVPHVSAWDESDPATEGSIDSGGIASGDTAAPTLWNPTTAVNLSVLFTPAFGTFLHARNSKTLGHSAKEKSGMYLFYGMVAVGFFGMLFAGSLRYFVSFNLLLLSVWYFTLAKEQINLVDATFGKNYSQKSFGKPLFVGIGCLVAALIFVEGLHSLGRGGSEPVVAGEDSATDAGEVTEKAEDPVDLFNRGVAYANGDGVTEDLAEAVKCYRKAADLGYSDAMNNLGLCYEKGEGVSLDYVQAVSWYRKAADQGSAVAQCNLGLAYVSGVGISKNLETAMVWFRNSATQGYSKAQYMLGLGFAGGEGVSKDMAEAVKWYRKAAEQGDAAAQMNLGNCYWKGEGVTEDEKEAVKWFRMAAEQGDPPAETSLGACHQFGVGVAKDAVEAVSWYRKAAAQGDAAAQRNLGDCYLNGEGVTKDATEALKWFRLAADQGDSLAENSLGVCYQHGMGVAKDSVEAVSWYRKAADQGEAAAQRNLGNCYWKGEGVTENEAEAVKWFRLAAEQGDPLAVGSLGVCYQYGMGVAKDSVEAVSWYRKAADQGEAAAQRNLGDCYWQGEGVVKDENEAAKWFRLAAEQGDSSAENMLGVCYQYGKGVTKDSVEAVSWYRKAADQGNAVAQSNLGDCYNNGEGIAKDQAEAAKWYQKSAEQGTAKAQFQLGLLNATGEGVPKDLVLAYMWWNLSAVSGDATAKGNLEKVSKRMTPEQIAEGQRLSREWNTKHQD